MQLIHLLQKQYTGIFTGQPYINHLLKLANDLRNELFNDAKKKIENNENTSITMLSEMLRLQKKGDEDAKGLSGKYNNNNKKTYM